MIMKLRLRFVFYRIISIFYFGQVLWAGFDFFFFFLGCVSLMTYESDFYAPKKRVVLKRCVHVRIFITVSHHSQALEPFSQRLEIETGVLLPAISGFVFSELNFFQNLCWKGRSTEEMVMPA